MTDTKDPQFRVPCRIEITGQDGRIISIEKPMTQAEIWTLMTRYIVQRGVSKIMVEYP